MKELTIGTQSVPAPRTSVGESVNALTEQVNNLQRRYYRSMTSDCELRSTSDRWYIVTIACTCATFICPPCILVAVYCYIMARKSKKGGSHE